LAGDEDEEGAALRLEDGEALVRHNPTTYFFLG